MYFLKYFSAKVMDCVLCNGKFVNILQIYQ